MPGLMRWGWTLLGLALAAGFWLLVYPAANLPAWQVAVLPAAVLGWFAARSHSRMSWILAAVVAIGASGSAILGDYRWFCSELERAAEIAREHAKREPSEQMLLAAIEKRQDKPEKQADRPELNAKNHSDAGGVHQQDIRLKAEAGDSFLLSLYATRLRRGWQPVAAALVLSVLVALQASRMSISSRSTAQRERIPDRPHSAS